MKLNTNAGPRTNRNIEKRRYHPRPVQDDFVSALHESGRPRLDGDTRGQTDTQTRSYSSHYNGFMIRMCSISR